jgi:hypothetical protein
MIRADSTTTMAGSILGERCQLAAIFFNAFGGRYAQLNAPMRIPIEGLRRRVLTKCQSRWFTPTYPPTTFRRCPTSLQEANLRPAAAHIARVQSFFRAAVGCKAPVTAERNDSAAPALSIDIDTGSGDRVPGLSVSADLTVDKPTKRRLRNDRKGRGRCAQVGRRLLPSTAPVGDVATYFGSSDNPAGGISDRRNS